MSRLVVLACRRCNLARAARLPAGVELVEMTCTGRVSLPLLLAGLSQGFDGILVLGRHGATCRFRGAERLVEERIERLAQLLEILGLGAERVRFIVPGPGPEGPMAAVEQMLEQLGPTPLTSIAPREIVHAEGLDTALSLVRWISNQPGLRPAPERWLARAGLRPAAPGTPRLLAAELCHTSLLAGDLLRPLDAAELIKTALDVLDALGVSGVGVSFSTEDTSPAVSIDQLIIERALAWPPPLEPMQIACDGSAEQMQLLAALGHVAIDVGPDPLPSHFDWGPESRRQAAFRLEAAAARGAQALLTTNARALMRWSLLTREGSWRTSKLRPILGLQLAALPRKQTATSPRVNYRSCAEVTP